MKMRKAKAAKLLFSMGEAGRKKSVITRKDAAVFEQRDGGDGSNPLGDPPSRENHNQCALNRKEAGIEKLAEAELAELERVKVEMEVAATERRKAEVAMAELEQIKAEIEVVQAENAIIAARQEVKRALEELKENRSADSTEPASIQKSRKKELSAAIKKARSAEEPKRQFGVANELAAERMKAEVAKAELEQIYAEIEAAEAEAEANAAKEEVKRALKELKLVNKNMTSKQSDLEDVEELLSGPQFEEIKDLGEKAPVYLQPTTTRSTKTHSTTSLTPTDAESEADSEVGVASVALTAVSDFVASFNKAVANQIQQFEQQSGDRMSVAEDSTGDNSRAEMAGTISPRRGPSDSSAAHINYNSCLSSVSKSSALQSCSSVASHVGMHHLDEVKSLDAQEKKKRVCLHPQLEPKTSWCQSIRTN